MTTMQNINERVRWGKFESGERSVNYNFQNAHTLFFHILFYNMGNIAGRAILFSITRVTAEQNGRTNRVTRTTSMSSLVFHFARGYEFGTFSRSRLIPRKKMSFHCVFAMFYLLWINTLTNVKFLIDLSRYV